MNANPTPLVISLVILSAPKKIFIRSSTCTQFQVDKTPTGIPIILLITRLSGTIKVIKVVQYGSGSKLLLNTRIILGWLDIIQSMSLAILNIGDFRHFMTD